MFKGINLRSIARTICLIAICIPFLSSQLKVDSPKCKKTILYDTLIKMAKAPVDKKVILYEDSNMIISMGYKNFMKEKQKSYFKNDLKDMLLHGHEVPKLSSKKSGMLFLLQREDRLLFDLIRFSKCSIFKFGIPADSVKFRIISTENCFKETQIIVGEEIIISRSFVP